MWPLSLNFTRDQDYGKNFHQRYKLLPWQPLFDAMFTQILAFSEFSPLINEISKTRAAILGQVVRKWVSFNQGLKFYPAIEFTSFKIDLNGHFLFS